MSDNDPPPQPPSPSLTWHLDGAQPTGDDYRAPPVSYSTGFFENILNPAGLDHGRYSPFASPFPPPPEMPPTTRSRPQPGRLSNGYVNLCDDSPPQRRKRESPTPGPSAKRQKREDGTAKDVKQDEEKHEQVESIDLTESNPTVQEVLQKQREDAVKAQAKPEETITTFNTFNCVICMDNPTDLTATACGMLTMRLTYTLHTNTDQAISSATPASWKP